MAIITSRLPSRDGHYTTILLIKSQGTSTVRISRNLVNWGAYFHCQPRPALDIEIEANT